MWGGDSPPGEGHWGSTAFSAAHAEDPSGGGATGWDAAETGAAVNDDDIEAVLQDVLSDILDEAEHRVVAGVAEMASDEEVQDKEEMTAEGEEWGAGECIT